MIFYFYGDNSWAINQQLRVLKARYLEKTGQEADLIQFDSSEHRFVDLLNSVAIQPMFATSRLIIVKQVSELKLTPEQAQQLIDLVAESTILVFTNAKPDKRMAYHRTLSKLKGAKEFKKLSMSQMESWVASEAKKIGLEIDKKTIAYLVDRVGINQWALYNEIQKLSAYALPINQEVIDRLVVPSLESSAFDLAEALVTKNLKKVLELYDRLKLQGQVDQMIFGAIVYQYRILLLSKLNSSDLSRAYKVSPYSLQKAHRVGRDLDINQIKRAYLQLRDCDIKIKSGELGSAEAMKGLFATLCR